MRLLMRANIKRISEFRSSLEVSLSGRESKGDFRGTNNEYESLDKQLGSVRGELSEASKKEIKSYRAYKKKKEKIEKQEKTKENRALSPVLPKVLKEKLKRTKTIKEDDISPTV